MKVLVLGGGVIGVTAAWYLAEAGHEVEVVDRQPGPALETSFANAGEVSPGYSSPWAGPGVPVKAVKWLLMKHGPLVVRPKLDPAMWIWLLQMLRNCTSARYAMNKARMVPLAEYSRDRLRELRAATGIAYDERALGTLQLFRTEKQVKGTAEDIAVLRDYGVPFEVLDRRRLHRRRAGARRCSREDRRRTAPPRRRDRRLPDVHRAARGACREARRSLSLRHEHRPDRRPTATASPASPPAAACCRPTPMSSRSAAIRRSC